MKQLIEILDNGGIVCDNPNCDFQDLSVTPENTHEWLNRPCPKCYENLLTQSDLDDFNRVMAAVTSINTLSVEELSLLSGVSVEDMQKDGSTMAHVKTHNGIKITLLDGDSPIDDSIKE
jgi:hypothetical protein